MASAAHEACLVVTRQEVQQLSWAIRNQGYKSKKLSRAWYEVCREDVCKMDYSKRRRSEHGVRSAKRTSARWITRNEEGRKGQQVGREKKDPGIAASGPFWKSKSSSNWTENNRKMRNFEREKKGQVRTWREGMTHQARLIVAQPGIQQLYKSRQIRMDRGTESTSQKMASDKRENPGAAAPGQSSYCPNKKSNKC